MTRALYTAATGMHAQQSKIDTVANNLANVNTTGFKQARAEFQDLVYQTVRTGGTGETNANGELSTTLQVGLGVRHNATLRNFEMGDPQITGNALDVRIAGAGFFRVRLPSGELGYTRDGAFRTNTEGDVVTADNYPLDPPLNLGTDGAEPIIAPDGTVTIERGNGAEVVGRITIVNPANPNELRAMGGNLYRYEGRDAFPELQPGTGGAGELSQRQLEGSNVKVVEEMVQMILGQRAYEANSKVIQTADNMLQEANRLR